MTEAKLSQRERVEKKYGKVVTYYAELLGICHEAVKGNSLLNKLDPMGQKTQRLHYSLEHVLEWIKLME